MGHKISPKDIQGDMAQFDRQTIETLREKLSEFTGSIPPDSGA